MAFVVNSKIVLKRKHLFSLTWDNFFLTKHNFISFDWIYYATLNWLLVNTFLEFYKRVKSSCSLVFFGIASCLRSSLSQMFLRRAYTMKFFFHNIEIFVAKEKCRNISGSKMCVAKYYLVCSYNQVLFIPSW